MTPRQLARRARIHVQQRQPRFDAGQATPRRVTEHFLAACSNGDVATLMAILAPGVTLYADSGGAGARAAAINRRRPRWRFFLAIWKMPYREWAGVAEGTNLELRVVRVNDGPAILGTAGERPIGVLTLDAADGVIQALRFVVNPD